MGTEFKYGDIESLEDTSKSFEKKTLHKIRLEMKNIETSVTD